MMRGIRRALPAAALVTALLVVMSCGGEAEAQRGARGPVITRITGDLYRASNGTWHSIFLVTEEGILIGDTLNTRFATQLREELDSRFPGVPVRWVVYSHSHWDHVEGGAVFADTATFIGHERMLRNMDGRYPHMPGDMIDRNSNGTFEPEEFLVPAEESPGVCGFRWMPEKDIDGDGRLTPEEFFAEVRPPDVVYSDRMRLSLGGRTVELIHPGRNHGDDMTVLYFPEERVVFAADFLADALVRDTMRSLPSACGPFDGHPLAEWIESYRVVEALDFDVLAAAHGQLFTRQDVTETREYFEYLVSEISAGLSAGLSLEEMKASVLLEEYRDWAQYERLREKNVEAAYRNLTLYR
jgi:glyoxylase-like metal-dependent hydrolase (beta-lactamase superfamily II)